MPRLRDKVDRLVRGPGGGFVILLCVLLVGVFVNGRVQTEKTINAQIAGCERGKQDRMAHVRVYVAMANYYDGVTKAESVKPDVKTIAEMVESELTDGQEEFRSRIVLCDPLIREKKLIPDKKLLRELSQALR